MQITFNTFNLGLGFHRRFRIQYTPSQFKSDRILTKSTQLRTRVPSTFSHSIRWSSWGSHTIQLTTVLAKSIQLRGFRIHTRESRSSQCKSNRGFRIQYKSMQLTTGNVPHSGSNISATSHSFHCAHNTQCKSDRPFRIQYIFRGKISDTSQSNTSHPLNKDTPQVNLTIPSFSHSIHRQSIQLMARVPSTFSQWYTPIYPLLLLPRSGWLEVWVG